MLPVVKSDGGQKNRSQKGETDYERMFRDQLTLQSLTGPAELREMRQTDGLSSRAAAPLLFVIRMSKINTRCVLCISASF